MAMDPRLYQKYSGRSGDPYSRLGAALSQSDAHRSRLSAKQDRSFVERHLRAKYQVNIVVAIVVFALVAGAAVFKFVI